MDTNQAAGNSQDSEVMMFNMVIFPGVEISAWSDRLARSGVVTCMLWGHSSRCRVLSSGQPQKLQAGEGTLPHLCRRSLVGRRIDR